MHLEIGPREATRRTSSPDDEIGRVRMRGKKLETAVDGVVISERDEVHATRLGPAIDVFRRRNSNHGSRGTACCRSAWTHGSAREGRRAGCVMTLVGTWSRCSLVGVSRSTCRQPKLDASVVTSGLQDRNPAVSRNRSPVAVRQEALAEVGAQYRVLGRTEVDRQRRCRSAAARSLSKVRSRPQARSRKRSSRYWSKMLKRIRAARQRRGSPEAHA